MKKTLKKVIALALSLLLAGVFGGCAKNEIQDNAERLSHYDNYGGKEPGTAEVENANKNIEIPTDIPDENKELYTIYTDFKTQIYTGTGDDVINIDTPSDGTLWVLYVKGNAEGRYFGVTGYTEQRKYTELFVNTTDPYEGTVFDAAQKTKKLEITASGDWQIEVRSITSCPIAQVGVVCSGTGDQVLLVTGSPDTADINGNSEGRYFGVQTYGSSGYDLLVNTTDAYNGKVLVDPDIACIVVTAVGDWTIKLN